MAKLTTDATPFRINGVERTHDEAWTYLDQAHAVACCLEEATGEGASMNNEILQSAARALATLIHLAAEALHA